jgi:soluble lytic murein transglycosylase
VPPTPTPSPTPPLPTATPAPAAILHAAEQAFERGDWTEAASLAGAAQDLLPPPLADSARLLAARSHLSLGKASDVIGLLEGADFTEPDSEALALYLLASAYREQGDSLKAIEKQTALLSATEVLTGWIHELNGDSYVQLGETDRAIESYRLAESAAQGTGRLHLLEKIAEVQLKAKRGEDALKTYEEMLARSTTAEFSAKAHYLMGLALREQTRDDAAIEAFRKATEASTTARESYLALVELVNAGARVDEFRRGLIGYQTGAYQAAIQAFERYLGADKPAQIADAWYYIGMAQLALSQYEEALSALAEALAAAPDLSFQAKVLMAQGRVLQRANRLAEARETYRKVQTTCPACDVAPQALWRSAEAAFALGDRAGAASDFLWLQRNYPKDNGADDAMLRAALLYYADSRYAESVIVCEEILSRYPASNVSAAAHFWAAKALLQSQQQASVAAHLQAAAESASPDYYSLRASAVLRGDTTILPPPANVLLDAGAPEEREECLAWLVSWANKGEAYDFGRLPDALANDSDYRMAEAFASLGLANEAASRFSLVRARWKDAPLALFQLAERLRDLGLYRQSIACAERIIALSPGGSVLQSPRYLQRLAFPAYYADLVLQHASLNGLDTLLVFAVIRQESRFDPIAGSWAGAMGLMQVIPPTGEWVALQLGIRDFRAEDLARPSLNVRFGTWYLGRQMRDFSGDPLAALAAYNGGPGNARLWLSRMAEYDPDLFVESIPFAETQTYVKTILEQYAVYRALYQPGRLTAP